MPIHDVYDIPWKEDQDASPGFFLEPSACPKQGRGSEGTSPASLPSPSSPSLLSPSVFLANSLAFEIQMLPWPFAHPPQEYLPFHLKIINK